MAPATLVSGNDTGTWRVPKVPAAPELYRCSGSHSSKAEASSRLDGKLQLTGNLMEQKLIVAQDGVCSMKGPDFSVIPNIRPLRGRHHVIG